MNQLSTVLEARDLTVTYGRFTAVDDVSLRAGAGEVFGLLGPNGAGKTSVIRALTTIVPVASGSATVGGHPLSDPVAVRSKIGVLPESNGYPSAHSGRSYLRFYGQLFGLSREAADARAVKLLDLLGLGANGNRIGTFSRGMRQRLGLARSLINDPEVLFLDEPTLGLDPAGKEEVLSHLTRVALDQGTCVVLCTHLLDDVERVCDRVAIMDQGRIVADGTVTDVVARSGAVGRARIQVAPTDTGRAEAALLTSVATDVSRGGERSGDIEMTLGSAERERGEVIHSLLAAGVVPLGFDLRGARLSDAFLALTTRPEEAPTGRVSA